MPIKLVVISGKKNRIINGVKFKDGEALLPDKLMARALSITKRYNVEIEESDNILDFGDNDGYDPEENNEEETDSEESEEEDFDEED